MASPSWSYPPTPPILPTSRTPSPSRESACGSPEPNCAICLGKLMNPSVPDMCGHRFCFKCLQEWSKVKSECPLCKTAFKVIYHSIRSDYSHQTYKVPSPPPPRDINSDLLNGGFRSWFFGDINQFRSQVQRSIQSLSLPSLMPVQRHQWMSAGRSSERYRRRGGLSTSEFRAELYRRRHRVVPDGVVDAITGRARETSPAWYRANDAQTHRLVPWLNRELNALLVNNPQNTMYVSRLVMEEILRSDIRSQEFGDRVRPYLAANTAHFQHEFYHFARSVYDMVGYDRHAQYVEHHEQPSQAVQPASRDNDDDDIVFVGEVRRDESPEERLGGARRRPDPSRLLLSPSPPRETPPSPARPSTSSAVLSQAGPVISVDLRSPEVINILSDNEVEDVTPTPASGQPTQVQVKDRRSESETDATVLERDKSRKRSEKRRKRRRRSPSSDSSSSSDDSDYERERKRRRKKKKWKGKGKGKGKSSTEARTLKQHKKKSKKPRRESSGSDCSDSEPSNVNKSVARGTGRTHGSRTADRDEEIRPRSSLRRKVRLMDEALSQSFGSTSASKNDHDVGRMDPSDLRFTLLKRKKRSSSTAQTVHHTNKYIAESSSDDEVETRRVQSKIVKVQTRHG